MLAESNVAEWFGGMNKETGASAFSGDRRSGE